LPDAVKPDTQWQDTAWAQARFARFIWKL